MCELTCISTSVPVSKYTGQQNLTFFPPPRTSIREISSTFYAEFRYVYIIFLSGRVSKIQRNLNAQNSTLRAHETGSNFPVKCEVYDFRRYLASGTSLFGVQQ